MHSRTRAHASRWVRVVAHFVTSFGLLIKTAVENWSAHKDAQQGAALAYHSVFSVGPLMIIAIAIAGLGFGQEAARGQVEEQLSGILDLRFQACRSPRPR
jgi:uncharacterized BrkB/YihY/UPF0761 family membrane protein